MSDEVYRAFCYDEPFASPAEFNEDVLVFDGFSKTYGMTGWRLGFAHGPRRLIEEMIKLQQFTFVCAPSMVQHAGVAAWDYRRVRASSPTTAASAIGSCEGLKDRFEIGRPGGAFYLFPKAPWGTGSEFVAEAIRNNLLHHSRQRLQPPRHAFPHQLRRRAIARSTAASRSSIASPDDVSRTGLQLLAFHEEFVFLGQILGEIGQAAPEEQQGEAAIGDGLGGTRIIAVRPEYVRLLVIKEDLDAPRIPVLVGHLAAL